jgi:hypothetical protein
VLDIGYHCFFLKPFDFQEPSYIRILKKVLRPLRNTLRIMMDTMWPPYGHDPGKMKKIRKFILKNFIYHNEICTNRQLAELLDETHCFLTGSDQIWNGYFSFYPFFFLNFTLGHCTKKVAYASSIGTSDIPNHLTNLYKQYLEKFDHLSLREMSGVKIIKSLTGKEVRWVLDPTFILSAKEWRHFCSKEDLATVDIKESYIFCYFVGDNEWYWDAVRTIQRKTGIKHIVITPMEKSHYNSKVIIIENVGPLDFVNLIDKAELVCTDSFHATALSINLKNDFIEFLRFDEKDSDHRIFVFMSCLIDMGCPVVCIGMSLTEIIRTLTIQQYITC